MKSLTISLLTICGLLLLNCQPKNVEEKQSDEKAVLIQNVNPFDKLFSKNPEFISNGFDYPVGKPNAKGYYNAQAFMKNNHLGDDWNAVTGGNSDLGDPIYSISNGYVRAAWDAGPGWGNIIRVVHKMPEGNVYNYVEALYAHCDTMQVQKGEFVLKGQQIGTIGNANGAYYAHLHFELRHDLDLPLGGGYSSNTKGYLDPTRFIKNNR